MSDLHALNHTKRMHPDARPQQHSKQDLDLIAPLLSHDIEFFEFILVKRLSLAQKNCFFQLMGSSGQKTCLVGIVR